MSCFFFLTILSTCFPSPSHSLPFTFESFFNMNNDRGLSKVQLLHIISQLTTGFHLFKMAENMFNSNEMKLLYEKAKNFINSPMERINFIYRDKLHEYFDEIEQNAQQNGTDQIMQGYTKNGTGHPECPIIVDQFKGLYFATSCNSSGIPLPSSPFGPRRLSVAVEYLLDSKQYSLFFADFYCARYTSDNHKVTLALCEIGSQQEFFCRKHLVELDMGNNPFLQCVHVENGRCRWSVAGYKTCPIYLFLCADFNITNCLKAGKCYFSTVKLIGYGISDHKICVGQTYDHRCGTCGIRNLYLPTNSSGQQIVTTTTANFDLLSLAAQPTNGGAADDWRIWKFDCGDLPVICPLCKTTMGKILQCNVPSELGCQMCRKFWKMQQDANGTLVVTTDDRWPNYIKKTDALFRNVPNMVDAIKSSKDFLWPSQIARMVGINQKFGIGIFRDNIVPDCDQHCLQKGGYFRMLIFENDGKMDNLDQIFNSFLKFVYDGGLATEEMRSVVSGIFVRAEMQLRSNGKLCYVTADLCAKFRFELWIQDRSKKNMFWHDLNKWAADAVRDKCDFGSETKFRFIK